LLVESVGLTLTFLTSRSISRGLRKLNQTAVEIGRGNFVRSALPPSKDELGQLASSLDQMGELLLQSHSELEARVADRTKELVRSRDQLDIVLKGITDGITVIDDAGHFVYVNDAGARMCGFSSRAEFLSTPQSKFAEIFEMLDDVGKPLPWEKLPSRLAFAGVENPPEAIVRFRSTKGGEERWSIVKSSPVFDEQRSAKLVVTIFKDFTERKRAEDALRFLDEASQILGSSIDYQTTLHSVATLAVPRLADWCSIELLDEDEVPQPVALVHSDAAKIGLATELRRRFPRDASKPQGADRVIGTGKSLVVNDIRDEQIAGFARDAAHLAALRALGIGSVMIVPVTTRGKALGAITFVSAESKRRYSSADLGVAEELARRTGTAIENARLYQIAQQAIESRDEFLSIASHELKTPLTSLKLQIQLAKRKVQRAEEPALVRQSLTEALELSGRQVDRLTGLIEDLMDVSRIRSGKLGFTFERIDLSRVIREVAARYSELLSSVGSSLTLDVAEDVSGLLDQTRIEQLIDNLLTNAAKYAPGKPIVVSLARADGMATLIVQDHGPGISSDMQERIFDRFERAAPYGKIGGLGLGLFIARKIVDGHGGAIAVESEEGRGTRFVVTLPLSRSAEVAARAS
jgi:signal transduction histidine kinase/PAS domain-containing protein